MPLYQKHVEKYRQRLQDEGKPHAAAIYASENKGDPYAEYWNEFFFDDTDDRREVLLEDARCVCLRARVCVYVYNHADTRARARTHSHAHTRFFSRTSTSSSGRCRKWAWGSTRQ